MRKYEKLSMVNTFPAGQATAAATENMKVAQKKLEAIVHGQQKVCDMLLHQVKQLTQVRDDRQRYLEQLQEAEMDDKLQQPQLQRIRQLGNDIEKMRMKIHVGQRVTHLYLQIRDNLKHELFCMPRYLDLMYAMIVYNEKLIAHQNLKSADVNRKLMGEARPQVRMEISLRAQTLAEQRAHIQSLQQKIDRERQLREQAASMHFADQARSSSDLMMGADVEATMTRMEHEAVVYEKMEKAKAALQCSCLWDIPSSLLAQQKTLKDLEQYVEKCKEDERVLRQTLKELELKQAGLKSHEPLDTARLQEEELRANLQREEARRDEWRAQMMRTQEQLIEFEKCIDNLFVRLHGIVMPGQEESVKATGMEEKLQQCEEKLLYLKQRVLDHPFETQSCDSISKSIEKGRDLLEKTIASDSQNVKISFEDADTVAQESLDFEEEEDEYISSREDIKKQGLQLIKINTKKLKRK